MSDTVNVQPTPIQRNHRDVALELTQLYYSRARVKEDYTVEGIRDTYIKMYATVLECECKPSSTLWNDFTSSIVSDFHKE
ncbi:hypothetical protein AB2T96_11135 [Clostridium butyricum]|uniref:hypothetical protein n=1 Tax=Clostridium butyricum TaxID=1492 RepID=UPI001CA9EC68|nr:hypothetical protein [Clostridium butyricum]MBZ0312755.1 hypothetical protein [Clostridium butyricum]